MKKALILGCCAIAMALTSFVGVAQEDEATTLTGEPVDMNCYIAGRSGPGHASCAKTCAENGNPIGLAVKDGDETKLYLVLGGQGKQAKDHMAEHMGQQVKVTGKVTQKEGMNFISVEKVEKA